jgi:acetone carboxylase gamma subunit
MFFCPNCNNMFDIARAIPQSGGKKKSEDFDLLESESESESISFNDFINKILNNDETVNNNIKQININELQQSQEYKKLKIKHKELVDNKIQDLLPISEKAIMQSTSTKNIEDLSAYFVCNNCGFANKITPKTKIFSRTSADISQNYTVSDYSDMLHSDILPRTRKYICPNKQCISYKDISKREAIFFRLSNTYKVKYICTACKTDF